MAKTIDWAKINKKLPIDRKLKPERKRLFRSFDPNGNGILSLAEVDKSIRDVLRIDNMFNCKPAIMRAFQIAKDVTKSKRPDGVGDDYIEFKEFRYFLIALRQHFEYYQAFARTDVSGDNRLTLKEFIDAKPKIEKWVGRIADMEAEFKIIDKNGGGVILFDEFCDWAIRKRLDLEDDNDNTGASGNDWP